MLVKEANAEVIITKMVITINYLADGLKCRSLWNCKIQCAGCHNFVIIFCCTKFMTQDILYIYKKEYILYFFFLNA